MRSLTSARHIRILPHGLPPAHVWEFDVVGDPDLAGVRFCVDFCLYERDGGLSSPSPWPSR